MIIERSKFRRISINCLLELISIAIYFTVEDPRKTFLLLSAVSIISFIIILTTSSEPISSPYTIFIIVLYVYNCGQVWLNLFGVPIIPGNYTITRYSDDLLASSIFFFILIALSINVCFILRIKGNKSRIEERNICKGAANKTCIPMFCILFLICLIYDYGQYRIAASSGYAAALYARSDNELLYMCNCAFPFFVFWTLRSNVRKGQKIFVSLISAVRYAATTIFIGYRMQAISFVLALIVLLYGIVQEKNKKKVTVLMVVGILVAAFLSIFSANLRRGLASTNTLDAYNALIQELGGTFTDLPIIIRDIDEIGMAYGLSYLCAVLYLIPFIGHILPGMSKYVNLSAILYTRITIYGNSSLGGSMLAEFFYNFKWGSVFIAAPTVGWIFAQICNALNKRSNDPFESAMLAYIFYIFLLFSRGNIGEVTIYIRCAVYIFVLYMLMKKRIMLKRKF